MHLFLPFLDFHMFKFLDLLCYIHVNLEIPSGRDGGFGSLYKFTFYCFRKVSGVSFNIKNFRAEIDLRDQIDPPNLFWPMDHFHSNL